MYDSRLYADECCGYSHAECRSWGRQARAMMSPSLAHKLWLTLWGLEGKEMEWNENAPSLCCGMASGEKMRGEMVMVTPPRKPPPGRRAHGHSHQRQQGTSWFIRQCQSEMEASTFINNSGGKQRIMKKKEKRMVCVQMAKWEIGFWPYRERRLTDRRCLNVAAGSCDSGHGAHYHNTLNVSHTDWSTDCVITPSIQRWQQFAEDRINNIFSHINQRHTPDSSTLARRLMLAMASMP